VSMDDSQKFSLSCRQYEVTKSVPVDRMTREDENNSHALNNLAGTRNSLGRRYIARVDSEQVLEFAREKISVENKGGRSDQYRRDPQMLYSTPGHD
jgi:hypothetical protein